MKKLYSSFPRKIALAQVAAAALFVNTDLYGQQMKYPAVSSSQTLNSSQTLDVAGKMQVSKEMRLLDDVYLEKLKDLAVPATQDRLVLIDKFGKMKGGPPFESIPPGNGGGNPNPQACTGFHWSEVSGTSDIFNCQLGNVGIGSSGANQKLTIKGGGIGFDYNSADKKLYSPADGDLEWMTNNFAGVHGFAVSHQGDKKVYLNTNGDSYFMGGNLGIGTISPSEKIEINGNARINDQYDLLLRNSHHGLGWYGNRQDGELASGLTNKPFDGVNIDGPVLYGWSGGALATYNGSGKKIALLWTAAGSTSNLANIQQNISNNRIALASTYTQDAYLPGLVWYTTDNNSTKPKAGIWVKVDNSGSRMYLGTSNSYPSGITNAAIAIESDGRVSIGGPGSAYKLDVGGDFRVISAGNAFVDINSTNQNSLLRLMAVSSSGRQEAQIQYRGILQFVEPLPGETGSTVRLTIDGAGTVHCKRVNVATSWSDFALKEDFKRMTVDEKEKFWKKYNHLPSVPSGKEIEKDGLDVGGVMKGMMQEVEETRLDVTEMYKIILEQRKEIELLKKEMEEMKGEK